MKIHSALLRLFTLIVFLITGSKSFSQSFSYPVINDSGRTIKNFIPPNWFLRINVTGDLNGDSTQDLAMVIEYKDTINEIRPDKKTNRARPRILLILFKDKNSGYSFNNPSGKTERFQNAEYPGSLARCFYVIKRTGEGIVRTSVSGVISHYKISNYETCK